MNLISYTIGRAIGVISIALPMVLITSNLFGQTSQSFYSRYIYNSQNFSYNAPDSVLKNMPVSNLELHLGNVLYINFYSNNLSKTEITFRENAGVQFNQEIKSTFFINDIKSNLHVLIEDSVVLKSTKYFMPVLTTTKISDTVNGFYSSLYTFNNSNGTTFKIWLSTELSCYVSPGFYFPGYGGITRIEYQHGNMLWTLDLESFEIMDKPHDLIKNPETSSKKTGKTELFPFFDVKQ